MVLENNANVAYYNGHEYNSFQKLHQIGKMHGVKRVALFCVTTAVLPTILIITPLYLRHSVFADVEYFVAESDVVAIKDGLSSIFCQSHTLRMNTSFNAFQLDDKPTINGKRKHIRLKKSMRLPDDTLEYWGFYLLGGATVSLKVCSRYEGSRILVVRGQRNLKTCGLLEHNSEKFGATMDEEHRRVKVTFETPAQVIEDKFDDNTAAEDTGSYVADDVESYVKERLSRGRKNLLGKANATDDDDGEAHQRRHAVRRKFLEKQQELYRLQETLKSDEEIDMFVAGRPRRETGLLLDGGIEHGGNAAAAKNHTDDDESSVSSFETSLLTCYDGSILLTREFPPSHLCDDVRFLERGGRQHMESVHEVASNGYYYYIFYSDNDFVNNDIHAVFDIYKPTFQYNNNVTESSGCINVTRCDFPISFWSDRTVIVEVPTRDGIEHEEDDITLLISTCHPRMAVYMIFPISVLFLILGCAFL